MAANEAARRLDAARQLLARAARDAYAIGESLAAPPTPTGDDAALRKLLAHLTRGVAEGVAEALDALNEMADERAEPQQHDLPGGDE